MQRFLTLILLLVVPSLGYSLSLGDIDLRSHLGEPLNARVTINDVETAVDASCFGVADTGEVQAFRKASVTLTQTGGNQSLSITSQQVITEPIVNLRVTYHCEPIINREYVLLLDPAPTVEPAKSTVEKIAPEKPLSHGNTSTTSTAKPTSDTASSGDTEATPVKKPPSKKRKAKAKPATLNEKLAEAYIGTSQTVTTPPVEAKPSSQTSAPAPASPAANTNKPYLVISGGGTAEGNAQPNLSLRMETQLDLNRTEAAPPLTATDTMDEVTMMSNRLAHLEKQILSLQTRNQQLQAEAEQARNAGFKLPADWLDYLWMLLAGIIVLATAWALRNWLMRRRWARDDAVWFDTGDNEADATATPDYLSAVATDPLFDELVPAPKPQDMQPVGDYDEVDSVLEHADVFIEHGRPILGIQLLQNHLVDAPTQSPTIWLKLLSLLAKEGSEAEYDATVIECNQFFNIKMPPFAEANQTDESSIEDYPHIIDRLEGAWGSPYAITLLNDLIYNQQSQPREGFARGTFEELFFLKKIAECLQANNLTGANPPNNTPGNAPLPSTKSADTNISTSTEMRSAAYVPAAGTVVAMGVNALEDTVALTPEKMAAITDAAMSDDVTIATSEPVADEISYELSTPEVDSALEADIATPSVYTPEFTKELVKPTPAVTSAYGVDIIEEMPEEDNTGDINTANSIAFNLNEQVDTSPPVELDHLQANELDFPMDFYSEVSADDSELTLHDDFAGMLEFDQHDLENATDVSINKEAEDDKGTAKKDDNVIEFDWDLPKITKD